MLCCCCLFAWAGGISFLFPGLNSTIKPSRSSHCQHCSGRFHIPGSHQVSKTMPLDIFNSQRDLIALLGRATSGTSCVMASRNLHQYLRRGFYTMGQVWGRHGALCWKVQDMELGKTPWTGSVDRDRVLVRSVNSWNDTSQALTRTPILDCPHELEETPTPYIVYTWFSLAKNEFSLE
jgi:hypothetical protein